MLKDTGFKIKKEMQAILQDVLMPAVSAIIASLITYFSTRKKEEVHIESMAIENAHKVLAMSEQLQDNLKRQLETSDDVITALKQTIEAVSQNYTNCQERVQVLEAELLKHQRRYNDKIREIEKLQIDCDALRAILRGDNINEN